MTQHNIQQIQHIIGGERITGKTFANYNPHDKSFLCDVAEGSSDDVDRAAQAAKKAFVTWRNFPIKKRRDLLYSIAQKIEENAAEIATLESMDTGQPIRFMKKAAMRGADNFRFFADKVVTARSGLTLPADEHLNYTLRQPIGPVGVITPWNTPFMLSTWKIAPALAAGCTVVHKPAELSPITAERLTLLMHEAGLPPGVVNVVNGFGETTGKSLCEHPDIKAIAFVGESRTGSCIMRQGADTLKRVHFELGGKNPVVVFADADIERAVDAVIFMKYSLNGERCTSSSRVIVQRSIYEEFNERLAKRVAKLKVGNPLHPDTEVGPLISKEHLQKVSSYVEIGEGEGAILRAKSTNVANELTGNYFTPVLFSNVESKMRIAQEEIFGPFLVSIAFESDEEALHIANDIRYGLAAYLWTKDITRAHTFAENVAAGMVWVNSQNVRHLPTPFGGMKDSGIGRDGGDYSFDFYMETKNIAIAMGEHRIPKLGAE
ncbi:5-carboxymethyl-2-hydroxymuconate semialdehyde dehydrogenase [Candidatus Uabimicrobium amorphum]|uniref:Aldehyde dehydrogenase n=1 Tax=Uabimicrobium amorphum TaxID=2596890 RepID=A0A5S9ISY1_UABAM|nr:5-carboxymethyl-2-hydroxymuconate semialdehyde dehydrogenase [Candidatus Uabimicrobium amorphum]BBM87563.1 aldehyde dehydrogenase [Candidatus Uabimicrobium amorphum]